MKQANKQMLFLILFTVLLVVILVLAVGSIAGEVIQDENDTEPVEKREETPEEIEERLEAERNAREEALREELGHFFVGLPSPGREPNTPVRARGLYLTGHSVGLQTRYDSILNLVETTELNSLVIDVKDDRGRLTYNSDIEYVRNVGSQYSTVPITDLKAVLDDLHERDIYPIARVVIFKDPYLAEERHDLAIQRAEGNGAWRDRSGTAWVNPYKKEVWDYNIAVAKEAALMGFREIQLDYVRFPEGARFIEKNVYYPGNEGIAKDDIITEFIEYTREQLEDYDVYLSADVFGVIATSWGDSDMIGQTWEKIAPHVDYICPMIYPSHYGPGYFGFAVPDANPGGTIRRALVDSLKRNAQVENPGIIRPWLQSFTASWVRGHIPYTAREVRIQIDTALKLGIDEYLIWNAGNNYPAGAFLSNEEAEKRIKGVYNGMEEKGLDYLGRRAKDAVDAYIKAVNERNWREAYSIQGTGFKLDPEKYRNEVREWTARVNSYKLHIEEVAGSQHADVNIDLIVSSGGNRLELKNDNWKAVMENNVWKVVPSEKYLDFLYHGNESEES